MRSVSAFTPFDFPTMSHNLELQIQKIVFRIETDAKSVGFPCDFSGTLLFIKSTANLSKNLINLAKLEQKPKIKIWHNTEIINKWNIPESFKKVMHELIAQIAHIEQRKGINWKPRLNDIKPQNKKPQKNAIDFA